MAMQILTYRDILRALEAFGELSEEDQDDFMEQIHQEQGVCCQRLWMTLTSLMFRFKVAHSKPSSEKKCLQFRLLLLRILRLMTVDCAELDDDAAEKARAARGVEKIDGNLAELELRLKGLSNPQSESEVEG